MKTAKQIFDFLPGIWKISRNIDSQVRYEQHIGEGVGIFTLSQDDPHLILYSEEVELNGAIWKQEYQYRYDAATSSISKYFPDGRYFYKLNMLDNQIVGEHLCKKDNYLSNYVFEKSGFRLTYLVHGPHKHYKIASKYRRLK